MSIESAKAFLERLRDDEEWRNKLSDAEGKEGRLAIVKEEGFDFSEEEYVDAKQASYMEMKESRKKWLRDAIDWYCEQQRQKDVKNTV